MAITDASIPRPATRFTPFGDRVLVVPQDPDEISAGGIIITGALDNIRRGEVIAVGETNGTVKVGDVIAYGTYSGDGIMVDRKLHVLLRHEDVLGRWTEDA